MAEIENVFRVDLQLELQTSFVNVLALQSHIPRYLVPPFVPHVVYHDSVVLTQFPEVSVVSGQVETSFVEQSSELSVCELPEVDEVYRSTHTQILLVAKYFLLFPIHEHVVDPARDFEVEPHEVQDVEAVVLENVSAGHDNH